jgi:hypothetical protein
MYSKNALLVRELPPVTIAYPDDLLILETASASNNISVADFVDSFSSVYHTFFIDPNGDLHDTMYSRSTTLSSTDLGRIRFVWKDTYNPAVEYTQYDVVYYNGSSFVSLSSSTGVTPVSGSAYWDLMALGYISGAVVLNVQNIAALTLLNPLISAEIVVDGAAAEVLGYYNPNDRGGGLFRWNSTSTLPDDRGSVICPTAMIGMSGRWIRLLNGEQPNVKMWGAQGTGLTDDTASIQAALSAMSYGWALELVFTSGNYLISNTLYVPSNIKISGEGIAYNTSIFMAQGITKDIMTTVASTTAGPIGFIPTDSGFIIENLSFYFQGYELDTIANIPNTALTINDSSRGVIISNVAIYGGGIGIKIQPLANQNSETGLINIENCFIFNSNLDAVNSTAIWLQNEASNINLKNISLSGSYSNGAILWNIPQLSAVNTAPYLKIQNCIFNGDGVYSTNFLTLSSTQDTTKIPVICIEGLTLNNCNNIIQDNIINYFIPSQTLSALQTSIPFYYSALNTNASPQDIIISTKTINTSTAQFIPLSAGWYTIFTSQSGQAITNLSIASLYESTNFDVNFNNTTETGFIKVNKFDTLGSTCVTRARVLSYNNIVYTDVYVNIENIPITISYRDDGQENYTSNGLCIPTLVDFAPDQDLYSGYEEVAFDRGIVSSSSMVDNGHLKLGDDHFWIENNDELRHYNEGVDILFVSNISAATTSALSGLYNTGVNDDGSLATQGSKEQHWNINKTNTTYNPALSVFVGQNWTFSNLSQWASNGPNSQWISPSNILHAAQAQIFPNTATFTYSLSFTVNNNANYIQNITGAWTCDDQIVNVTINGISTGLILLRPSYMDQPSANPFIINTTNLLINGINKLEITVNNSYGNTSGLRVEFVTGQPGQLVLGTGARARGYIQNGSVARVNVLDGGVGYILPPNAFAIPNDGGGSGAVLLPELNNGQVTKVTVLSGGSGYGTIPTFGQGRKFITNTEFSPYGGEPIRNVRRLNYETYKLSGQGNSQVLTGLLWTKAQTTPTGLQSNPTITTFTPGILSAGANDLLSCLYPGDKLAYVGPLFGLEIYEVVAVIDQQTVIVTPPLPSRATSRSNATYIKVGWEIFPSDPNYRYLITGVRIYAPIYPSWSSGTNGINITPSTPYLTLALRTKGYTSNAILWYLSNSQINTTYNTIWYQQFTDGNIIYPFLNNAPSTIQTVNNSLSAMNYGTGWGMSSILPPSLGISIDLITNTNYTTGNGSQYYAYQDFLQPLKGSLTLVEVFGYKYPVNSNY